MYTEYFKLRELPFRLGADSRFCYVGAAQQAVRGQLRRALFQSSGAIALFGDPGVGKTLLADDLLRELTEQHVLIHVRQPDLTVTEFYQVIHTQLVGRASPAPRSALLAGVDTALARENAMRRTVVTVIDAGEVLAPDLLEELLRLGRRSTGSAGCMKVFMIGRPALPRRIAESSAAAHSPRVVHMLRLDPLPPIEIADYLEHRLAMAGCGTSSLFGRDCVSEFARFTGGVPRLINMLADATLMLAFNSNRAQIHARDVARAADHLKWVEFGQRADADEIEPVRLASLATEDENAPVRGRLSIEHAGRLVAEFDLPVGKLKIGRANGNDVRVDSPYISRHHCHVITSEHYSVIEDLQSQNGILVGSRKVSVHRLRPGDRINLGDYVAVYSRREPAEQSSPPQFPMLLHGRSPAADSAGTQVLA